MSETTPSSDAAYSAIASLLKPFPDLAEHPSQRLRFHGSAPAFDSPHRLTLSSACAVGAYALGVEKWWHMARDEHQVVAIDWMQAACALNPGQFQEQAGYPLPALSLLTELKADFYKTRDGRWFFPIGSYPHLRDGVLDLLECPNNAQALAASIGKWTGDDLEDAFEKKRLPGVYARTTEEWLAHPQGRILAGLPAIQVEKIADSEPEPAQARTRALDNIRVLDLGHVIAGPVVARTLAEHGADVLRVTSPMIQDPFRQTIDTNIGKRSAFFDFDLAQDRQKMRELMNGADVVVQSWRPSSMEKRGFGPEAAAALRPGVIYVSVSAFGDTGPWATRGGFEQLGQTVSGIAISESADGKPRVVPPYLLNDYLTGYLGAAGVMMALIRRAREGGSYHVKVSLARTSMWVQSLGLQRDFVPAGHPRPHFAEQLAPTLETRESAYGTLKQFPPVAQFSRTLSGWTLPPAPNGAHPPCWLPR